MDIDRRGVLRLLTVAAAQSLVACGAPDRSGGRRVPVAVRTVDPADAPDLQAIMTSSVCDPDAFFGQCGEWSLEWAADLIARCPDAVVLLRGDIPIAFLEIPPIRPEPAALPPDASEEERARYAQRLRNRTTFRVTAAGIRDDLLSAEESVPVFLALLYHGFVRARGLGYEAVEAVAPWERHPRMTRKWTDYPGCDLVEPVSYTQGAGTDLYWLRWRLEEAIDALAAQGAGDALDVQA